MRVVEVVSSLDQVVYYSVHEPSVSEVAAQIASVVPVGPPVAPRAYIWLPDRVLDNAKMVRAIVALARVQGEANDVRLRAEL